MIHRTHRRGFTVAELLVILLILAALVAMLFPVFCVQREHHGPRCSSHLKQLGIAVQLYLQDYDDRFPPASYVSGTQSYTLPGLLHVYTRNGFLWTCPQTHPERDSATTYDLTPADITVDYGYNAAALNQNGKGVSLDQVADKVDTVVFVESSSYRVTPNALTPALGGTPPAYRHQDFASVGWVDGHVKRMSREELEMTATTERARHLGSGIDCYPYWNLR